MSSNPDSTEAKQIYLREHIPQDKYEDFGEFCEVKVGSVDIESWSIAYVKDLVEQFKLFETEKEKVSKNEKHQSFYSYQTGNEKELKELRDQLRKQQGGKQAEKKENTEQARETKQERSFPKTEKEQQSAMALLDSIFQNNSSPNNFQTKKYDKTFFQSSKFWQVPSVPEPKTQEESPSKAESNFNTNSRPMENCNFEQVFSTGLNIEAIKQEKTPSPALKKNQAQREKTPKSKQVKKVDVREGGKSREWKLMEIPIEDDKDFSQKMEKGKETREWKMTEIPIQDDNDLSIKKEDGRQGKKNNIKLVSVKAIKPTESKLPYKGEIKIHEVFKTKVACFKSFQRINLSSKDLRVTITNHEIIERSFFSSNYPMFHLKVEPAHIVCKRNFEDFEKLKKNLQAVYPGIRLPYLEKAGWLESQTSGEYIQRQKKYLQYFLQDVVSHRELRNSRILEDFLTLKDHKSMKRKFQEYEKISKVNSIEELCLLEGEVAVQISEQHRQYCELAPKLLEKMNLFLGKQEVIMGSIQQEYQNIAENYSKWGEAIRDIKADIQDFNRKVSFRQLKSIESSLNDLYRYTSECQNFNQNQVKFLTADFVPFFRYEAHNMGLLDSVVKIQSDLTSAYLKRSETENKQEQYLSERLKQFKVSLLSESKNFTVLKYQCGYLNEIAVQQMERYFERVSLKISRVVSDVCYAKLSKLSQSINICTELVLS